MPPAKCPVQPWQPGEISPGETLTLFGSGLGPAALTQFTIGSNGLFPTQIAGTSVTFNGIPAPMIYTSSGLVAVVAPSRNHRLRHGEHRSHVSGQDFLGIHACGDIHTRGLHSRRVRKRAGGSGQRGGWVCQRHRTSGETRQLYRVVCDRDRLHNRRGGWSANAAILRRVLHFLLRFPSS